MNCSRMRLTDRKEVDKKREGAGGCDVCGDLTNRRSFELNSLVSWQRKTESQERRSANISISELVLPSNVIPKKSPGAQRWTNRRPRLRSSTSQITHHRPKTEPVSILRQSSTSQDDTSINGILKTVRITQESSVEYEIDENVMKLIEEANEFDKRSEDGRREEIYRKKKKKRKKRRKIDFRSDITELDSLGITKQVTLSRPVSPATEQVIRVDVVSTFSVEENFDSDLSVAGSSSRVTTAEPKVTIKPKSGLPIQCPELTVRCQKLRLSCRKTNTQPPDILTKIN